MLGKFLVGCGLMIMACAIAYYGLANDLPNISVPDRGASLAFLTFLVGVLVAIIGGISTARG